MDRITLTGVTAVGHHGVFDFERRDGQPFVVDAVLYLDFAAAAASDDVSDTAHYGEVAQRITEHITGEPLNLIEALAVRIADGLLAEFPLQARGHHRPQTPGAHRGAVRRRHSGRPPRTAHRGGTGSERRLHQGSPGPGQQPGRTQRHPLRCRGRPGGPAGGAPPGGLVGGPDQSRGRARRTSPIS